MKLSARSLLFSYTENQADKPLFHNLHLDFNSEEGPLLILGPSGCGKSTLLKLLGGLLKPQEGKISFSLEASCEEKNWQAPLQGESPKTSFMFQEPRLLPWLTVLENVSLPLEKEFGSEEGRRRARHFISLVSLKEKCDAFPKELSGGQAQRVSMARAFAWPAPFLFMDEPFQSLDIPLRITLMDLTLSLLEINRLLIAVSHDPREAVYMGGRIIVLGNAGDGIVFDRIVNLPGEDRAYGSAAAMELERELIKVLESLS